MATFNSIMAGDSGNVPSSCQAGEVRATHGTYELAGTESSSDVINLVKLPAQHVPVDLIFYYDAIGGSAATDVGITADDVGATEDADAFIGAQSIATAGFTRADEAAGFQIAPVDNVRKVGLTLTAAAAAAGTVAVTLFYRAAQTYDEIS